MYALLEKGWYGSHPLFKLLKPFSLLYQGIVAARRAYLQRFVQAPSSLPIIVVGNITVGGVGKTPMVLALAKALHDKGLHVGIVSRGYRARIKQFPYEIQTTDDPNLVGDEPLLLAQKTHCPVVIAPKRVDAVSYLVEKHQIQIIISDDGLQHYAMGRTVEIALIDGTRGLGNGLCLPAGPLREPSSRLHEVDFIVVNEGHWDNAYRMHLQPGDLVHLATGKTLRPQDLQGKVSAVTGIGNPQRFYNSLKQVGISFTPYTFPDHHQFKPQDLPQNEAPILMTEKDAVKCRSFQRANEIYYLPVQAELQDGFWEALWSHHTLQNVLK